MSKRIINIFIAIAIAFTASAQGDVGLKDLAVPKSPAFQLTDIAPTLIEAPSTPKEFAVGVLQSFDAKTGWPQSYAMETTPYWWLKKGGRDVYKYLGIKRGETKEDIFSGLKFTSLSLAFMNKDLVPDTFDAAQKVFAIGARATIIRVHGRTYARKIQSLIVDWHAAAQVSLDKYKHADEYLVNRESILQMNIAAEDDSATKAAMQAELAEVRVAKKEVRDMEKIPQSSESDIVAEKIATMTAEKPIFQWDVAGAYALYGIGDSLWQTGRTGIWTTISSYVPLNASHSNATTSYISLQAAGRYLFNNYTIADNGLIVSSNAIDAGGKIGLEVNRFSFAAEAMYRHYTTDNIAGQYRVAGIINYKLKDDLYINGSFGRNFGNTDNLISLFGINWGFGAEKVTIPEPSNN